MAESQILVKQNLKSEIENVKYTVLSGVGNLSSYLSMTSILSAKFEGNAWFGILNILFSSVLHIIFEYNTVNIEG
jgi:hypothetical protein